MYEGLIKGLGRDTLVTVFSFNMKSSSLKSSSLKNSGLKRLSLKNSSLKSSSLTSSSLKGSSLTSSSLKSSSLKMLWSVISLGTQTELWSGHGCSGHRNLRHGYSSSPYFS